jgi:hypothetical protein
VGRCHSDLAEFLINFVVRQNEEKGRRRRKKEKRKKKGC